MARRTKKQALAARQDPAAPFLFDEEDLPLREDLVKVIADRRYEHTGARLLDNETLALRLVERLLAGWGLKRIAAALHVSKHSVRAAREELVRQGKLAPYKERVVRLFEEIVERGAGVYLEQLEKGLVPAAQIPVGVGIFSDKRALALGEPTAIGVVGAAELERDHLSVERLNAWVAELPIDAESTGKGGNPGESRALAGPDATLDAGGAGGLDPAARGAGGVPAANGGGESVDCPVGNETQNGNDKR